MKPLEEQIKELRGSSPSLTSLSADSNLLFSKTYGEKAKIINDGIFIPGKIYIADYATKTRPSPQHPYINRNPIFLFIKSDKSPNGEILISMDLNVIPSEYRGSIILKVWNQYQGIISENQKNNAQIPIPNFYNSLRSILNGTGWQSSLTGFRKDFIRDPKEIRYEDWVRLPYITDTKIEGASISKIYNYYRSKLNA